MPKYKTTIGKLHHRLTIQRLTETRDGFGAPSRSWSDLDKAWGRVRPISGSEYMQAQQVQANHTHEITIRYAKGITPKDRIQWVKDGATRTFDIESIGDREERKQFMVLRCTEVVQ